MMMKVLTLLVVILLISSSNGQEQNSNGISRKTTEDIAMMANDIESQYTCKKPIRLYNTCDFETNPMMEVIKDNNGMTTVHLEKEKHQVKGIVVSENCVVNVYQHLFKNGVSVYGAGSKNAGLLIKGPKKLCVGKALHKVKTITIEDTADAGTLANKMDEQNTEAVQKLNTFQTDLKITMAKLKGEVQAQKTRIASKGPKGPTGNKGFRGDHGIAGNDGETGATGEIGIDGKTGDTGMTGLHGNIGASITGSRGATGATGKYGVQGATGGDGKEGSTGVTGPTGMGIVGPTGSRGATGSTGGAKKTKKKPLKVTKRSKEIYHKIVQDIRKNITDAAAGANPNRTKSVDHHFKNLPTLRSNNDKKLRVKN
jgi:hypothetical protein